MASDKEASCSRTEDTEQECAIEASSSNVPPKPDRKVFQEELQNYNEQIASVKEEIKKMLEQNNPNDVIRRLREQKIEPKRNRDELKKIADEMKPAVADLKKQLDEKERQILDMENDLVFKDEVKLTARLNQLEDCYSKSEFTSARKESLLITEINKLKRNRAKLSKYNALLDEKRKIKAEFNEIVGKRSNLLKSIRELTGKLQSVDESIRKLRKQYMRALKELEVLYCQKNNMIGEYEQKRKVYTRWTASHNRNPKMPSWPLSSYPATYPLVQKNEYYINDDYDRGADAEDDETLEPFFEQKMVCRRLIEYLSGLRTRMSPEQCVGSCAGSERKTADDSDDSAEDYPPSFASLRKHSLLRVQSNGPDNTDEDTLCCGASKKKLVKKSYKKPTQPISHPIELMKLFKEIEVEVPQSYKQIEQTLEEVKKLLKHYEEQTSVIEWDESDYQKIATFSESADSALNGSTDISERGSCYGLSNVASATDIRRSISSPDTLHHNTSQIALLCLQDEGIESKDSTR